MYGSETVAKVLELLKRLSVRETAEETGVAPATVQRMKSAKPKPRKFPPDCRNRGCGRCTACEARAYRRDKGKAL